MASSLTRRSSSLIPLNRKGLAGSGDEDDVNYDPATALASARHAFSEHGGINNSVEASATFRVLEPESMRRMMDGDLGPDHDLFVLKLNKIKSAICGTSDFINSLMDPDHGPLMLLGPTMNPKIAFELSEWVPHLTLTIKEISKRALTFATRLQKIGIKVIYPGLVDHPQHELLKSMANKGYGFGGLIGVDMGSVEKANELMYLLQNYSQFGFMAASLGHYETLLTCSGLTAEEKAVTGMSDGFVRVSVGYLGTLEQRWGQFEKALWKMMDNSLPYKK